MKGKFIPSIDIITYFANNGHGSTCSMHWAPFFYNQGKYHYRAVLQLFETYQPEWYEHVGKSHLSARQISDVMILYIQPDKWYFRYNLINSTLDITLQ